MNALTSILIKTFPTSILGRRRGRSECYFDGGSPSLRRLKLWRQRQEDRTAHHRIDDGQNGYDCLQYLLQARVEIRLQVDRHSTLVNQWRDVRLHTPRLFGVVRRD